MTRKMLYPNRNHVTIVLNQDERQALNKYAYAKGSKVSPFVRNLILAAISEPA